MTRAAVAALTRAVFRFRGPWLNVTKEQPGSSS